MTHESDRPRTVRAAIRLLAAALAGAIGAFGAPAAAHRTGTITPASAPTAAAATTNVKPD